MALTLPPGLLAAVLLFWGWRADLWFWALLLALILEAAPYVNRRWALSDRELGRVVDLTALLWLGALGVLFARALAQPPLATQLYALAGWGPLLLFPPLAIQRYSTAGTFRVGHWVHGLRRSESERAHRPLRLDVAYFLACLLAAGVTSRPFYLPGVGVLLLWVLLARRPRRYRWPLALTLALAAGLAAWPASQGLHRLQSGLEETFAAWLQDRFADFDPYRSSTALGDIGSLKVSERIVLRLKPPPDDRGPWLLRAASYNTYFDGVWLARGVRFARLEPWGDGGEWRLHPPPPGESRRLDITLELRRGTGMLPLPVDVWRLTRLPVGELQLGSLGALKASDGPGLIEFAVESAAVSPTGESHPPTAFPRAEVDREGWELDLGLPRREQATLYRLADDLGLTGQPPAVAAARLRAFLRDEFRYSLDLPAPAAGRTALETFLLEARAGHCEYFATAAVLLLRAAGVPARYATGFSVSEYSPWEGAYVARRRHAHAWALVWLDGGWRDFDATPPDWTSFEAARAPWWQDLSDLWDWSSHRFNRWRWREASVAAGDRRGWWGAAGLLAVLLVGRLLHRRRVRRLPAARPPPLRSQPGAESPFYRVLEQLADERGPRPPGEPLERWLRRIGAWDRPGMADMVRWHQRWRFDPAGLPEEERRRLAAAVAARIGPAGAMET